MYDANKAFPTSKCSRSYRRIVEPFADYTPSNNWDRDAWDRVDALKKAFKHVVSMLPREKSMVFFLATNPDQLYKHTLSEIARKLMFLGHEVYVVLPLVTTFEIRGMPEWAQAVYRVKTFDLVKSYLDYARELRKSGVKTIVAGAQHVPQVIVSMLEARYGY
ncbi:MAG: hypothetical protein QXT92_05730 [Nitrososphaerota archaeon]